MTAITHPYNIASLAVASKSFTTDLAVTAYRGSSSFDLRPLSCRVKIAGRSTPRVTATIVVAWPSSSTRAQLDPRNGLTVLVAAGYRQGNSYVDAHSLPGALRVQTVTQDYVARTVTIVAASDEAVVIAYPFDSEGTIGATSQTKVSRIKAVIEDAFPGEALTWTVDPRVDTDEKFKTTQASRYGQSRWEAVNDWAEAIGAKVYSTGKNQWAIDAPDSFPTSKVRGRLKIGTNGTVTAYSTVDTRDQFYNRLMIQWVSRSGTTTTTTTAIAKTSLLPVALKRVQRNRPVEDGRAVARNVLKRGLRRSHAVSLTAVAYYWLRPGHTVTVDTSTGVQERVLVDAVEFDVVAGTMVLAGRSPLVSSDSTVTIDVYDETTT